MMKKLLLIMGGVILSLSASATTFYKLHVRAIAYYDGNNAGGKVYLNAKNPDANERDNCEAAITHTGTTATDASGRTYAPQVDMNYYPGSNGDMPDISPAFDCTGQKATVTEAAILPLADSGYEFVCFAKNIKANGIYDSEDCYGLIHGNGSGDRTYDFKYQTSEPTNNDGEFWVNAFTSNAASAAQDNNIPKRSDHTYKKGDDVVTDFDTDPNTTIYAIFRPVGATSPRLAEYTAHFINFPNWWVSAYAWRTEQVRASAAWTGDGTETLDVANRAELYGQAYDTKKITFNMRPDYIIFNNGIENDANGKTEDMTFIDGAYYTLAEHNDVKASKLVFLDSETEFQITQQTTLATNMNVCYPRQFTVGQKSTVCLPFALTADQASAAGTFYRLTGLNGTKLNFEQVSGAVDANTPYIFEAATAYPFENLHIETLPVTTSNGPDPNNPKMISTLETVELTNGDYTYFGYAGGQWKKVGTGGAVLKPFRSCIALPTGSPAAKANSLEASFEETTGILDEGLRIKDESNNPSSLISHPSSVYDLSGRKIADNLSSFISHPSSRMGVKIVNGKKYMNR